jgi:hypothetical protein
VTPSVFARRCVARLQSSQCGFSQGVGDLRPFTQERPICRTNQPRLVFSSFPSAGSDCPIRRTPCNRETKISEPGSGATMWLWDVRAAGVGQNRTAEYFLHSGHCRRHGRGRCFHPMTHPEACERQGKNYNGPMTVRLPSACYTTWARFIRTFGDLYGHCRVIRTYMSVN